MQDLEQLLALASSLKGDVNLDGHVDFVDFLPIANGFGQPGGYSDGDLTCNGLVDFPDFVLFANHFGSAAEAAVAVPEPLNSLSWLLLGVVVLVFRRRSLRRTMRGSTDTLSEGSTANSAKCAAAL